MSDTTNVNVTSTASGFELVLYPKKDKKTYGWRWHDNGRNQDFGPTFDLMDVAHQWFDSRNMGEEEEALRESEEPTDSVELETHELTIEHDELDEPEDEFGVTVTEVTESDVDPFFDDDEGDNIGNK